MSRGLELSRYSIHLYIDEQHRKDMKTMIKLIRIAERLRLVQIMYIVSVFGFIGHVDGSPTVEILLWFMMVLVFGVWSIRLMVNRR